VASEPVEVGEAAVVVVVLEEHSGCRGCRGYRGGVGVSVSEEHWVANKEQAAASQHPVVDPAFCGR
jgi:hypothetical protein